MSKKTIWLVTFGLSLTLLGLFTVQGFWIRNAMRINEQQFNQLINKSLDNVVEELENQEVVYKLKQEMKPYEENKPGGNSIINFRSEKLQQSRYSFKQLRQDKEILKIQNFDSLEFSTKMDFFGSQDKGLSSKKSFRLLDGNLESKFIKSQLEKNLGTDLSEEKVFVENIVNKLVQIDVDIEKRVDKDMIDSLLAQQLKENDVNLDYEFAVTQKDSVVFSSDNYQSQNGHIVYKDQLYPGDLVNKNNYLEVYFNERDKYIFKSMGAMTLISLLLSLIIIVGFALTTHIMFKQKRLSLVKNDFVNNMTHELKTPISTISLASQMLQDNSIPKESKNISQISNIIDDETKRLSCQVEKVLKTALFNKGRIKIKPKELDIHSIIENVVKSFYLQVEQKNGNIHKNLEAENHFAKVDEVHFTNIIFNLLDNAVKYSSENPDIKVETKNYNGELLIAVEDNGLGIRKKDQSKIFEQFYRVPTGNLHDVKGFGLGLNYVKKMVEQHGGNIDLVSEYKKGTRFEITIPSNNQQQNGERYS